LKRKAQVEGGVPPRQKLRDFGPAVAKNEVCFENHPILMLRPRFFRDVRVEVVVPSGSQKDGVELYNNPTSRRSGFSPFAALLSNSSRQAICDHRPLLRPVGAYEVDDLGVFFRCPWPLHELRVQDLPCENEN